jgi:hypothetical protein
MVNIGLREQLNKVYKQENKEFFKLMESLKKAKYSKEDAMRALEKVLNELTKRGKRVDLFIDFIYKHFSNVNRTAYNELKQVFSRALSV